MAAALAGPAVPARAADPLDNDPSFYAAAGAFANGQYEVAIERLANLLSRYPRNARLQMMLADAYEHAGRPSVARKLYQAALTGGLDKRSADIAAEAVTRLARQAAPPAAGSEPAGEDLYALTPQQTVRMSVVYDQEAQRKTEHFEITTWNPMLSDVLAKRAEAIMEQVRRTVLGGQLYPHRIELVVYSDRNAFLAASQSPHWSGGSFTFRLNADGSARRLIQLYQVDDEHRFRGQLLSRELPHELAHVMLREYFGEQPCPLWLDEGLACSAEVDHGQALAGRMVELLDAEKQLPLADMIDQINPRVEQGNRSFYVQATSLTRFLRSLLTDAQMKELLEQLKEGQKPSVALGRLLMLDNQPGWQVQMERQWFAWARKGQESSDGRPEDSP
ncbi:MAG: hypothetical protein BIFFINMI_01967 [Phycisphaerae bacterium]|nr:hypothetical protein [Phycisphaerae bacterium]